MENKKQVAHQLVKLAKELTSAGENKVQKAVADRIDKAFELLSEADTILSNNYTGDKRSPNDVAVHKIRFEILQPAMKQLNFASWFRLLKNVEIVFKR